MRIAIIGAGISGLGAAYLLRHAHQVTLYEKNAHCGGHSRTIDVQVGGGRLAADTGFMVCNERNYPLLFGLLRHLGVALQPAPMSFGVSIDDGWLEYGSAMPFALLGQRQNLLQPRFWGMLFDILRFNRAARRYLACEEHVSLGTLVDELGLRDWFRCYYLLPMTGAIWSAPVAAMAEAPAASCLRFLHDHGLLTVASQPRWFSLVGGSRSYVRLITRALGGQIRTSCAALRVERGETGVIVHDTRGETENYDQVVLACHADQALALLADSGPSESEVLGAIRYRRNRLVVHQDPRFMPRRRTCWSSWNYLLDGRVDDRPAISVSYWLNRLQSIETASPLIATLNPAREPAVSLDDVTFEHPILDAAALRAQARLSGLQGARRTWYCGAYHGYGFHEDGLRSAVAVARKLGADLPWT